MLFGIKSSIPSNIRLCVNFGVPYSAFRDVFGEFFIFTP